MPKPKIAFQEKPESDITQNDIDIILRRDTTVRVGQHKLTLREPVLTFYVESAKRLFGTEGGSGLIREVATSLKAVAAQGSQAEIEAATAGAVTTKAVEFLTHSIAVLLVDANPPDLLERAFKTPNVDADALADRLASTLTLKGLLRLLYAVLDVADAQTVRGFFDLLRTKLVRMQQEDSAAP
jgi:hypothetical protein